MTVPFREAVTHALTSLERLDATLEQMTPEQWQPVADVFAAKLPEFDAVAALPGGETLATRVAQARGLQVLDIQALPAPTAAQSMAELILCAAQLTTPEQVLPLIEQAQQAGWKVLLLAVAVERTSDGTRAILNEQQIPVRALLQVAQTPQGLVFERRAIDRWMLG